MRDSERWQSVWSLKWMSKPSSSSGSLACRPPSRKATPAPGLHALPVRIKGIGSPGSYLLPPTFTPLPCPHPPAQPAVTSPLWSPFSAYLKRKAQEKQGLESPPASSISHPRHCRTFVFLNNSIILCTFFSFWSSEKVRGDSALSGLFS